MGVALGEISGFYQICEEYTECIFNVSITIGNSLFDILMKFD